MDVFAILGMKRTDDVEVEELVVEDVSLSMVDLEEQLKDIDSRQEIIPQLGLSPSLTELAIRELKAEKVKVIENMKAKLERMLAENTVA